MHGMQTRGSKTFKNCFFKDNIKQRYNFNISPLLLLQNYFLKFSNRSIHRYFKIYYINQQEMQIFHSFYIFLKIFVFLFSFFRFFIKRYTVFIFFINLCKISSHLFHSIGNRDVIKRQNKIRKKKLGKGKAAYLALRFDLTLNRKR